MSDQDIAAIRKDIASLRHTIDSGQQQNVQKFGVNRQKRDALENRLEETITRVWKLEQAIAKLEAATSAPAKKGGKNV